MHSVSLTSKALDFDELASSVTARLTLSARLNLPTDVTACVNLSQTTRRMSKPDTKVIVVGAGPAGVSLAYLLASRGISVTLLERHQNFNREFRGEVLLSSGLEALQQVGLGDIVTRIPHTTPTAFELYTNA